MIFDIKFLFLFENRIDGVLYLVMMLLNRIVVIFIVFWERRGKVLGYLVLVLMYNKMYLYL